MRLLKQSSTAQPLVFLLVQSSDHITGLTGASPTVTLSKNGGSFASPAGSVSEIGNGWYQVAGNATDTSALGPLVLHATATSADPCDREFEVVAFDPQAATNLGLSALPTANPAAAGGLPTVGSGAGQITLASGAVTVGTNNDKTGYALTQAFPANFAALGISAGGHVSNVDTVSTGVTVATNNDKSGYALSQAFPANFAALGITSGGKLSEVALVDTVTLVDTLTTYTGNSPQTGDAYAVVGSGTYGNSALQQILAADRVIDTATDPTQFREVFYVAGTSSVIFTKKLYDANGNKLNSTSTVVGQARQ